MLYKNTIDYFRFKFVFLKEKVMSGMFIFIIFIIVICISLIIWKKVQVTKALDLLEENIYRYETLAKTYLANENILKELGHNLHNLGDGQRIELVNMFVECEKIGKQCSFLASTIKGLYDDAYSKLDTQRIFHNVFGGGANDIAAFLYYSSERRLKKLGKRIQFVQFDIDLLKKVCAYIKTNVSPEVYNQLETYIREL